MTTIEKKANRLAKEKSPYLLQHAYNPVDWYPWGEEALSKAKIEDKPIFLSIGYSTCHWCHVMERESFEDEEVAQILNEHFVPIKVDREERPDLDTIYMSACQAMTGQGGWPLTVFLTPQGKPFFAGTYFPKESRYGMPGLIELCESIIQAWKHNRQDLLTAGERVTEVIKKQYQVQGKEGLKAETLDQAYYYFVHTFDSRYGGFGGAPKFPVPHNFMFLLRYYKLTGEKKALEMVEKTLETMYLGGIYDHIGFGFARYSTDEKWLVPHFEKMLYDNALLAYVYGEAYQATQKEFYAQVAQEILTYVLRDMTALEGAFYSAEDADSEGEEGKFYLWSPEEVLEILGLEEGKGFCQAFDITPEGNFNGKSIPNLLSTGLAPKYQEAREKLFQARKKRTPPFKDDKILTAWNGLMIAALSFNSRALGIKAYALAAEKAVHFILKNLRRFDGRLLARFREGEAAIPGFLEDYAFFIWGLLELYQALHKPQYLRLALELNQEMLELFWDEGQGGFFQYGSDTEELVVRPKEIYDGALPSGNSVALYNLVRLSRLTGDPQLEKKAQAMFKAFAGPVSQSPAAHTFFLLGLYLEEAGAGEVTVVASEAGKDTQEMLKLINSRFLPELFLVVKTEKTEKELKDLMPALAERNAVENKATAFVCKNFSCQVPTTDLKELKNLLP